MESNEFRYIVSATNDMHRIFSETIQPGEDDFRKVFAVSCNTLRRVVAQTEVLEDLRKLAIRQEQFWAEYEAITGNVDHFVNGFCKIEREVLIAAGINEAAAESFIQEAIRNREYIKDLRINPSEVRQSLKKLRDEACGIAKQLHGLPKERDEKRKAKKKLKKFLYGIGGAAIVVIDGGAFALSMGMSMAGTAVSGSLGSGLVGAALAIE